VHDRRVNDASFSGELMCRQPKTGRREKLWCCAFYIKWARPGPLFFSSLHGTGWKDTKTSDQPLMSKMGESNGGVSLWSTRVARRILKVPDASVDLGRIGGMMLLT